MKKLVLTVLLATVALTAFTQKNFLPGYIIVTEGDTVRGYVDYRNWKGTPDEVVFKKSLDEKPLTFKPLDIDAFGVADEVYISAKVEIELSPTKDTDLSSTADFTIEQAPVFLQTILDGEKSLYYLLNRIGTPHYYIKRNGKIELLRYKRYAIWVDHAFQKAATAKSSRVIIKYKLYTNQLESYLDHPGLKSKLKASKYNRTSLGKLFASYYKSTGRKPAFEKTPEKAKLEISALAGLAMTTLKFKGGQPPMQEDFGSVITPTGGVSLDVVFPRKQRKWSLNNELIYTFYELSANHVDYTSPIWYTNTKLTAGGSYLKLNTLVRFKFPAGKMFVFVNGGMTNAFALDEVNERIRIARFGPNETTTRDEFLQYRKYEVGLIGGVGASVKNFSLQVRYEASNGMSAAGNLQAKVGRTYFMLGYRLK